MQDKKMYVFSFNPPDDLKDLHQKIDKNPRITDWMHHISNTYLIVSNGEKESLYNDLHEAIGSKRFILMEVDPKTNYRGWLPQDAWTWLKKYQ